MSKSISLERVGCRTCHIILITVNADSIVLIVYTLVSFTCGMLPSDRDHVRFLFVFIAVVSWWWQVNVQSHDGGKINVQEKLLFVVVRLERVAF